MEVEHGCKQQQVVRTTAKLGALVRGQGARRGRTAYLIKYYREKEGRPRCALSGNVQNF